MKNKNLAYLYDIKTFCDRIFEITADLSEAEWGVNWKQQDIVHYNFVKIGEAVNRIRNGDPDLANRIPEIRGVIGFRNKLTHEYDHIDDEIVWSTIKEHVPIFYNNVCDLLEELDPLKPEQSKLPSSSKL